MLIVCPTADYEMYLGRNLLPVEQVLFEPTRKLMALWKDFGIQATIFPDICSVWRHRELGMHEYADRFEEQIRDLARAGHDVQLHLHPEWLTAEYREGRWEFAPRTGALHDRGFDSEDENGAPRLIHRAVSYLRELVGSFSPEYRCVAFRAGGWILQPEHELVRALLDVGIRVDATVIPGVRLLRTDYSIDFRRVPPQPNWYIGAETGLSVNSANSGDLLEIPIASYRGPLPMWQHVLNEFRLRQRGKAKPQPLRGYPIVRVGQKHTPMQRISRKFQKLSTPRMLDIADTCESMLTTVDSYLRKYDCRSRDVAVCMNGHPKDTYDHHLDELKRFFAHVQSRYADVLRFETVANCYTHLEVE